MDDPTDIATQTPSSAQLLRQADTPRARRIALAAVAIYAAIVLAQAAFQFFFNSDNWRTAGIAGSDGQAYYAHVRSLVVDGDMDYDNELFDYNYNRHGFHSLDDVARSPYVASNSRPRLGRVFNRYGIGYALMHLPFFLIAHLIAIAIPAIAPDGYTLPYQFMPPVGAIAYGLAAFLACRRIMLRYAPHTIATLTTLVLFLAYQGAFPIIQFWCNPHIQSLLVFNLMILLGYRIHDGRAEWGAWALLGALTGLAGLLHTEQLLFGILPAALAAARIPRETRRMGPRRAASRFFVRAALSLAACAAVFFLQVLAWRIMWGKWLAGAMNNPGEHFNWTRPVLLKILFSTRHGLFYWSPVLLLGAAGLARLIYKRRADTVILCALPVLLTLYYVYASWNIWWMGYSFGARQFIALTPLFAVGLAHLFERLRRRRALLIAVSVALVGWNQVMLWLFLNGHIPRSEGFAPWLPLVQFARLVGEKIGI